MELTHSMNCPAETPDNEDECTCGLKWRIHTQTAETILAAWQKRANEAELELSSFRPALENLEVAATCLKKSLYCDDAATKAHLPELAALTIRIDEARIALENKP